MCILCCVLSPFLLQESCEHFAAVLQPIAVGPLLQLCLDALARQPPNHDIKKKLRHDNNKALRHTSRRSCKCCRRLTVDQTPSESKPIRKGLPRYSRWYRSVPVMPMAKHVAADNRTREVVALMRREFMGPAPKAQFGATFRAVHYGGDHTRRCHPPRQPRRVL